MSDLARHDLNKFFPDIKTCENLSQALSTGLKKLATEFGAGNFTSDCAGTVTALEMMAEDVRQGRKLFDRIPVHEFHKKMKEYSRQLEGKATFPEILNCIARTLLFPECRVPVMQATIANWPTVLVLSQFKIRIEEGRLLDGTQYTHEQELARGLMGFAEQALAIYAQSPVLKQSTEAFATGILDSFRRTAPEKSHDAATRDRNLARILFQVLKDAALPTPQGDLFKVLADKVDEFLWGLGEKYPAVAVPAERPAGAVLSKLNVIINPNPQPLPRPAGAKPPLAVVGMA
jgi:hypothetical protein